MLANPKPDGVWGWLFFYVARSPAGPSVAGAPVAPRFCEIHRYPRFVSATGSPHVSGKRGATEEFPEGEA